MQKRTSSVQRKIAAKILKCGVNRVWIDPFSQDKVQNAITREDIRRLIKKGIIKKLPEKKNKRRVEKKKQRKGSRKGSKGAREGKKEKWLKISRPQRKLLRELKTDGKLKEGSYRKLYRLIKGGFFRSKAHMMMYIKNNGLMKEE